MLPQNFQWESIFIDVVIEVTYTMSHYVAVKDISEYFASIPQIKYEGPDSKNVLAFRYYNANEVILGKPMKDWLRFSVCHLMFELIF